MENEKIWFNKDLRDAENAPDQNEKIEKKKGALKELITDSIGEYEGMHGNAEEVLIKTQLLKDQIENLDNDFHVSVDSKPPQRQRFEEKKTQFITSMSDLNQKIKNLSEFNPSIQSQMIKFDRVSNVVIKFLGSILKEGDINQTMGLLWDENKKVLFNTISEIETMLMADKPLAENNLN